MISCPPPWEPIDSETDTYLAGLVDANLSTLLAEHASHPHPSSWALVRYHADPDVSRSIIHAHRCRLHRGDPRLHAQRPRSQRMQLDSPVSDPCQAEADALEAWATKTGLSTATSRDER